MERDEQNVGQIGVEPVEAESVEEKLAEVEPAETESTEEKPVNEPVQDAKSSDDGSKSRKVTTAFIIGVVVIVCLAAGFWLYDSVISPMSEGATTSTANNWAQPSSGATAPTNGSKKSSATEGSKKSSTDGTNSVNSIQDTDSSSSAPGDYGIAEAFTVLSTPQYDSTVATISQIVTDSGATITEREETRGGHWYYTSTLNNISKSGKSGYEASDSARKLSMTISVPTEKSSDVITKLSGMSDVICEESRFNVEFADESIDAQSAIIEDVAEEIAQQEAIVNSESASEADKAAAREKLRELKSENRSAESAKNSLEKRSSYVPISITLFERVRPVSSADDISIQFENMGKSITTAFMGGLSVVVTIIGYLLPWVLVAGVVIVIVLVVRRVANKK